MQEKRGTCTGLQQAHQQQHLLGHPQQEGSDKGWCGCSSCTIHQRYRHHLLGCGSNKQVIMLRSVGLDVPLGGSRGPVSASGGLWGACGCKIR